ncbi:MAG: hypothetical protein CL859_06130 [Cyanobium sp. ARS6]|nr:hypothetical protein [Cyanobium sp. ARS6]
MIEPPLIFQTYSKILWQECPHQCTDTWISLEMDFPGDPIRIISRQALQSLLRAKPLGQRQRLKRNSMNATHPRIHHINNAKTTVIA